ncbi:MAG TPA: flagellar hook capping FlgD N-terminal domain-containing protein [Acidobacteriota bacterium]|nr:flagellar hook capping FlgD N-terminal domain-containing protein [Acidobacteriota bacterium]
MSTVDGISYANQPQSSSGGNSMFSKEVGQDEFMRLFITQLQHQDPINPVSNEQFIAQLATFSSLEQLIAINKAVTRLAGGA